MSTMSDRETVYDQEIAQRLREIGEICVANGIPMLAAVYYDGEDSGLTAVGPGDVDHPSWHLLRDAYAARGNLDALCMRIVRRVPAERDGSVATKLFRPGNGAFLRGAAMADEDGE